VLKRSQPSRVVTVSSLQYKTGNIDINDLLMKTSFNRFFAYGNSKLANILFSRELARRLQGEGHYYCLLVI
jgi:NAD(P)-dependent dehydrogenase (short-subunit alcohol dehydrogenase family)